MKVFVFTFLLASVCAHPCSLKESLNITNGERYQNGSVVSDGVEYPSSAWYELEEDGVMSWMGCPCIGRLCLWKCCPEGQAFYDRRCNDSHLSELNPFSPPVYKDTTKVDKVAQDHFFYMTNKLCVERYLVFANTSVEQMYIQEDGSLFEVKDGRSQWQKPSMYCVDMLVEDAQPSLVALVCYPTEEPKVDDSPGLYVAYAIGLLLSVPFLLATFAVYALIPELRNLHGMCLMAYCSGLVVAYVFLAYLKMHIGKVGVAMTGCYIMAFIVYYFFQTSFFWLNVMCFDIWRTFSGYRGGNSNKKRDRRRFALYGLYAWGVPLLLLGWTIGMQFADLPTGIVKPGFGTRRCWFADWISELVFFFSPVLVLVVCNVVLFSVTAHRIRSIRQETAILKGSESARSDRLKKDKQRYGLYLKLFVVMGVNWSVELISFGVGGSNWYWILVDVSNIALGFFIFLIFVWKKKVRNLAVKRFRTMFGMATPTPDTRKSPWTSTSHTEDTRVSSEDPSLRLRDMR